MARLLPDPPSRTHGILTKREFDAALRVLTALKRPSPATVVMSWDNDMQDALAGLVRARYVEQHATPSDRLETTERGKEYLQQIQDAPKGRHHVSMKAPRKRKKSPAQLDREIAASLKQGGQTSLAALFADPEARRVVVREARHEIQRQQAAQINKAAAEARPFTVKRMEDRGERRVRAIYSNLKTEAEARELADKIGGWVERRSDGRVIYGEPGE